MRRAVEVGRIGPPPDVRYLRGGDKKLDVHGDTVRARIITFLEKVYNSQAETLPDFRDDTLDDSDSVQQICLPIQSEPKLEFHDPYADENIMKSDTPKQKKLRKRCRTIEINQERLKNQEERWLPPGTIKDIWEQMKISEGPDLKPVSFCQILGGLKSDFCFHFTCCTEKKVADKGYLGSHLQTPTF